MEFTPKSETELAEENLFPKGVYAFEVVKATDSVSKKGNDMIELKLRVFNGARTTFINDYLLESFGFKLRHAMVYTGLEDEYNSGSVNASLFEGRSGFAKVGIKKDKNGAYPDQNTILDYVESEEEPNTKPASIGSGSKPPLEAEDDDIPF